MSEEIQHIGIVGSGNVAWLLSLKLQDAGCKIDWVYSRNELTGRDLATMLDASFFSDVPKVSVDLVLVCVADDQIPVVLNAFKDYPAIAYTSGTFDLSSTPHEKSNIGVFYPLQTMSKGVEIDLFNVPFFIEAGDSEYAKSLFELAWKLSRNVKYMTSEKRGELHVAAVMVNNFTNHLFERAASYCESHDLDFNDLMPLIEETFNKIKRMSPYDAQTGPARRNDQATIQKHLSLLEGHEKALYDILSKSIQNTYNS